MKKDMENYEKNLLGNFIKILVYIIRWLCLALCVINVGLLIGFLVMIIFNGSDISNEVIAKMMELITYYDSEEALELINNNGLLKCVVGTFGYGLALSITYGVKYVLINNFIKLLNTIIDGEMYTKENVKLINDSMPLSVIVAFTQPVIVFVCNYSTNLFGYDIIDVSGVTYICVAYLLKLIFEKGYELARKNFRYNKELSNIKAQEAELKLEKLKKEVEVKESKSNKKVEEKEINKTKKTMKKATKK